MTHTPPSTSTPTKFPVRFAIADDTSAEAIASLLEALGYTPIRVVDGSARERLAWAVHQLGRRAKLTPRERDILTQVLYGHANAEIATRLGIRKPTVKWHMHNIFSKTGTGTREALLRLALQLDTSSPTDQTTGR